jgi:hypothetical protein
MSTGSTDQMETCLKLALRAQNQTRTTWEAVSRLQNPAVYMRQTNIAHNQQINNKPDNPQNKLLEQQHGERLDFGTASAAGRRGSHGSSLQARERQAGRVGQRRMLIKVRLESLSVALAGSCGRR